MFKVSWVFAVATGFSLTTRQSLMGRGTNAAVIFFLVASVNKWPALTEVLAKIDMILRLQEAQNDYRSSFVSLVCRYRRCFRCESLRMATGRPLRAQAEQLEQVGAVPAISSSRDMYAKTLSVPIALR
jgi:hypothetical protein